MALATSLTSFYKLEANSNDSAGSNNCTDTSVTYTAIGPLVTAASYNGSSSHSDAASFALNYSSTSSWTWAGWCNMANTTSGYVWGTNVTPGAGNLFASLIKDVSSGFMTFQIGKSGTGATNCTSTVGYTVGAWEHYAMTYDGANKMKLYRNGELVQSATYSNGAAGSSGSGWYMMYANNSTNFVNGSIAGVGVWSGRVLTRDEIQQLFNNGKANQYPLTDTPSLYGVTSYYQCEAGNLANALDVGPANITMTNKSSTPYAAGKIGRGIDGGTGSTARQFINTTKSPISYTETSAGMTMAVWVKPNSSLNGTDCYWGGVVPSNGSLQRYVDMLYTSATNTVRVRYGDSSGNTFFNTTTNPSSGTWFHFAFTYDGSTAKTYINGSQTSTGSFTAAAGYAAAGTSSSILGSDGGIGSLPVNAVLDEYLFAPRGFSAAEVTALYNSGNGLSYPFNTTSPILDAITDVTATNTVSSKTFSHTCSTASNRVLYVLAGCSTSTISGVTYNGVAMTRAVQVNLQSSWSELWYLVAPATGTNNVVITCAGSNSITGGAVSYINAAQTGQPDATHADGAQTGSVTSYSQSITTVTANDMVLLAGRANGGIALTGTVINAPIQPEVDAMGMFGIYGTTPVNPAQANTLAVTSSAQQFFGVMAAVKPYSAPVSSGNSYFFPFM